MTTPQPHPIYGNLTCTSPLKWPSGYTRTPRDARQPSKFGGGVHRRPSVSAAMERLKTQLGAFTRPHAYRSRTADEVLTSNVPVGAHGQPKSNLPEPQDVGVALYFELDSKPVVLCCDKWDRVGCNIAAIAATLEAMRGLERWGVTECERVFTGFAALPDSAAVQAQRCWDVLGIAPTMDLAAVDLAWKAKARAAHPDVPGGSHELMTAINEARDHARAHIEASQPKR